jgi:hypothetical protein
LPKSTVGGWTGEGPIRAIVLVSTIGAGDCLK